MLYLTGLLDQFDLAPQEIYTCPGPKASLHKSAQTKANKIDLTRPLDQFDLCPGPIYTKLFAKNNMFDLTEALGQSFCGWSMCLCIVSRLEEMQQKTKT